MPKGLHAPKSLNYKTLYPKISVKVDQHSL